MATEEQKDQAYRALSAAADRIGMNNYRRDIAKHLKAGRSRNTFRSTVTEAHRNIVNAMSAVLDDKLSVEDAMALIHEYDADRERFPKNP